MGTIKAYWRQWLWRDAVTRVITVNFIVWVAVAISMLTPRPAVLLQWLMVPGYPAELLTRPWTVLTYMFTHADFMHMFINMTWFLLFGRLLMHILDGRRMVVLYIYGGLCGALVYVLYSAFVIAGLPLLGASAAVLAVIGAAMVMAPNWSIPLFIFGEVKVKWIGVAALVLFVVLQHSMVTFGLHLGGFAIGVLYALLLRRGVDITRPVTKAWDWMTAPSVNRSGNRASQASLDDLLAKVSRSGYSSLTPAERQRLFELSQNIKK